MSMKFSKWPAVALASLVLAAGGSLARAQRLNLDMSRMKSSDALRSVFQAASSQANQSTVTIKINDSGTIRQIALGTIVSDDGFILSKASEVVKRPNAWVPLMTGGAMHNYNVKVVGVSTVLDLAMLKIDAQGLTPVNFSDTRPGVPDAPPEVAIDNGRGGPGGTGFAGGPGPGNGRGGPGNGRGGRGGNGRGRGATPVVMPTAATAPAPPPGAIPVTVGEWVASASSEANLKSDTYQEPFAVGVISTVRRRIAPQNGFLGVLMGATDGSGTKIVSVQAKSPAEKAGIKADDVVTAINGMPTPDPDTLRSVVQKFGPGDTVTLSVVRGNQTLSLHAALGVMTAATPEEAEVQRALAGEVNVRAGDFPAVFQHDTVIRAVDCGGPIVDLDGHVLGINIARAGRTETYAIPADLILPLIQPLESGKMAPSSSNAAK